MPAQPKNISPVPQAQYAQSYSLALNDAIREITDPHAVMEEACRRLAQYCAAGQVVYAEINGDIATVGISWNDGSIPDNAGSHRISDYGAAFISYLSRGETVVVEDVAEDQRTCSPETLANFASVGIFAFINVPIIKDGALVALLVIHQGYGRKWTDAEIEAAQETAKRTWSAVEQARIEQALRLSEERLRLASAAAGFGVHDFDVATKTGVWSESLYRLLGLPVRSEMPFADAISTVHPIDRERVRAAMQAIQYRPGPYELEFRAITADGETRWLVDRGEAIGPVDPQTDRVRRVVGTIIDMTERKATEARLRERVEELESLLDDSPIGISVSRDPECREVSINPSLARLLRMDSGINASATGENAAKLPFKILKGGRELEGSDLPMQRCVATGKPVIDEELEIVFDDGRSHHIVKSAQPLFDLDGKVRGCIGFNVDVTRHKIAEEQLRRNSETYLNLIQNNPFGIYLVDSEFRLAVVSAGAQQVFSGIEPLIGRDFADIMNTIWQEPFASDTIGRFRHTLSTGERYVASNTTEARNDVEAVESYDWKIERVTLPDGRHGVVCYFYDLTEQKRHEDQIRTLMYEVNHRSKNMLSLVAAVARHTVASGAEDFIKRFEARIQAMAASQDLLVRSEWKNVPISDLIRSQLAHFQDLVGVRISLAGPPLQITPSAAQALGMALHELATNSGKYGSLSVKDGLVDIDWQAGDDLLAPRFQISWIERNGPRVDPPSRKGFGSTVMDGLAKASVGGTVKLDYASTGLVWRLDCPLDRVLVAGVLL